MRVRIAVFYKITKERTVSGHVDADAYLQRPDYSKDVMLQGRRNLGAIGRFLPEDGSIE
jgi:hypothetical protein